MQKCAICPTCGSLLVFRMSVVVNELLSFSDVWWQTIHWCQGVRAEYKCFLDGADHTPWLQQATAWRPNGIRTNKYRMRFLDCSFHFTSYSPFSAVLKRSPDSFL